MLRGVQRVLHIGHQRAGIRGTVCLHEAHDGQGAQERQHNGLRMNEAWLAKVVQPSRVENLGPRPCTGRTGRCSKFIKKQKIGQFGMTYLVFTIGITSLIHVYSPPFAALSFFHSPILVATFPQAVKSAIFPWSLESQKLAKNLLLRYSCDR